MPVDTRTVEMDITDEPAVTTFLSHVLEFALGGERQAWESARSTPLEPRLTVVRPWVG
ncbi:hypothetical protein [Actinomycetospora flava]|uniref:GNAT family N-acetyltransferase n=1 Tax=Actinomycetospora flava TaxID=3129232 RepID=A0ABU8M639_9PSEU